MILCLLVARDPRDLEKDTGFPGAILILTLTAPQLLVGTGGLMSLFALESCLLLSGAKAACIPCLSPSFLSSVCAVGLDRITNNNTDCSQLL